MRSTHRKRVTTVVVVLAAAALIVAGDAHAKGGSARRGGAELPFEETRLIIEFNSTAQDAGVQIFLDADDAWKNVKVIDPNGRQIFEVQGKGELRGLGLSELFFESDEPSIADQPLSDLFAKFPEGEYKFIGIPVEGGKKDRILGAAMFSHVVPDGPVITSPAVLDPSAATISWNSVTTPAGVQIVGYEVVIEKDTFRVVDVTVPGTVTSVTVPPQFLQPANQYAFEVLAIDATRNQTITESSFSTP